MIHDIQKKSLKAANDKLADTYEAEGDNESARQFHAALDKDSNFVVNIIGKISQLRLLKEELERRRTEPESRHMEGLEWRLTEIQEQVVSIQSHCTPKVSSIWTPTLPMRSIKPPYLNMPTFTGDVLKC